MYTWTFGLDKIRVMVFVPQHLQHLRYGHMSNIDKDQGRFPFSPSYYKNTYGISSHYSLSIQTFVSCCKLLCLSILWELRIPSNQRNGISHFGKWRLSFSPWYYMGTIGIPSHYSVSIKIFLSYCILLSFGTIWELCILPKQKKWNIRKLCLSFSPWYYMGTSGISSHYSVSIQILVSCRKLVSLGIIWELCIPQKKEIGSVNNIDWKRTFVTSPLYYMNTPGISSHYSHPIASIIWFHLCTL